MFANNRKFRLCFAIVVTAAALSSGCTTLKNVHVDDENVRDVAGSVVFRPESMRSDSSRRTGEGGIELAYERHRGAGSQQLVGSDVVSFGGQQITAPQIILNDADSQHGHIAYNYLLHMGEYFELEPSLGLAFDATTVNVRSNSPTAPLVTQKEKNWGVHAQVTPRWNFNDYAAMELRARVSISRDSGNSRTIIPSFVLRPVPNVAIHAGYMWFSQELETPHSTSNVDIKFEGPSVALRFEF